MWFMPMACPLVRAMDRTGIFFWTIGQWGWQIIL